MASADTAQRLKAVLGFYASLGFDRLPLPDIAAHAVAGGGQAALDSLRDYIGPCARCKLSKGRKNIVFGEGSAGARLMFVGEGPGREEDLQGRPFVGDAGKLLTSLINRMGFKRTDVYIANIVKCRPPMNRDPEPDEVATCVTFLKKQIEIVSPKAIMALGRVASQTLTGMSTPISRLRGKLTRYEGIPLMPTYHPAYLLRNPKDKALVWSDAQAVLALLGKGAG